MNKIGTFLRDVEALSSDRAKLIDLIRSLFNDASKQLTEDIKYGGIVYISDNELIGGIYSYQDHISIEFSHGADFSDPEGILEGKGKRRRHIKVMTETDITAKNASGFIKQALEQ